MTESVKNLHKNTCLSTKLLVLDCGSFRRLLFCFCKLTSPVVNSVWKKWCSDTLLNRTKKNIPWLFTQWWWLVVLTSEQLWLTLEFCQKTQSHTTFRSHGIQSTHCGNFSVYDSGFYSKLQALEARKASSHIIMLTLFLILWMIII